MFSNRELARKLKTELNSAALQHTFGRDVRSCDVEIMQQSNTPESQPSRQTRIKLLGSFQESYMSDHSFSKQEDRGPSKSQVNVHRQRIQLLKKEVERERMMAETSHNLVQIERAVNEYLRERLNQSIDRSRPPSGSIHRNLKPNTQHIGRLVTSFLESGENYCRTLEQLTESYGQHL